MQDGQGVKPVEVRLSNNSTEQGTRLITNYKMNF